MNKRNLIPRIIVFPAMMFVYFIPAVIIYFKFLRTFFLYGGEMVTYFDKKEVESVQQLYYRLKQEQGENEPVYGKDLEFISKINRDGTLQPMMDQSLQKFCGNDRFFLRALSLSEGTYIAHGFNSYIVKKKQ